MNFPSLTVTKLGGTVASVMGVGGVDAVGVQDNKITEDKRVNTSMRENNLVFFMLMKIIPSALALAPQLGKMYNLSYSGVVSV